VGNYLRPPGGRSAMVVPTATIKHVPRFENRPTAPDHLIQFNPKPLKAVVQKCGCPRGKFENRLLGPAIFPLLDADFRAV
jgi:hypothetical protein